MGGFGEIFRDLDRYGLGRVVLDVGTGFGETVAYLLRRGVERVYTVDVDPAALLAARRAFRSFVELGVLRVVMASAEELPFGDGQFDSVVSVAVLHHVRDVAAALREARRVSRGLVVLYDWTPESAGVTNPHGGEELRVKMERAVAYAKAMDYEVYMGGLWYKLVSHGQSESWRLAL